MDQEVPPADEVPFEHRYEGKEGAFKVKGKARVAGIYVNLKNTDSVSKQQSMFI